MTAAIPRTTGRVDAGGDTLYYETAGAGEPLVLCHGLGGNGGIWFHQVPVFAEHRRVVVWDQRGFGRSTDHRDCSVECAVDDLERILDHLGVDSCALAGQSMGGWAALGLALRSPDRVRALVLSATTGGIVPAGIDPAARRPPPRGQSPRPLGQHPALGAGLRQRDVTSSYLYQVLGSFGSPPAEDVVIDRLLRRGHPAAELGRLAVPVLMLAGEHDELFPPALLHACGSVLPHARVRVLSGVGHSGYFEDPEAWNREVRAFLDGVADRSTGRGGR